MNIYKKEIMDHMKQAIGWIFGSVFLIWVGMMKYQGLDASSMKINDLIASLPRAIRAVMGGSSFDLNSAGGFYGIIFTYLLVIAAIYASHLGSEVINKEELYHTSEFLFAKPIARKKVLLTKMAASITHLMIFNVIIYLISLFAIATYDSSLSGPIFTCMLFLISIQCLFFALAMFISSKVKNYRKGNQINQMIILVTYLISFIVDMGDHLNSLKFLTPFRYQDLGSLIVGGSIQWFPWLLVVIISGVLVYLAIHTFDHHDLLI